MLRKLAIAATVLVGVFVIALVVSMATGWGTDKNAPPTLDPSQLPERFQTGQVADDDLTSLGQGIGGWIQRTDPDTGRLIQEFRYATLEPRQQGEFDVTDPEARLYVAPHRVVTLRAKKGVIVAPDNIPQQGAFREDVIVTLYETEKGKQVDLRPGSDDIALTIQLDDATFDTRLGKIDSAGRVLLDSEQARFRGKGLTLVYNEPKQRIDYLEVLEGESLTYTPPPTEEDQAAQPRRPVGPGVVEQTPSGDEEVASSIQYYKVVFERDIKVVDQGSTIDAQTLVGLFSFDRRASEDRATSKRNAMPPHALASNDRTAAAVAAAEQASEQIVMTWKGKMVVTPLLIKPDMLAPTGDVLLTFTGSPVKAVSEDGDVLTARHVEYHESWGQIGALGSPAYPLNIDSPALGKVRAEDLTVKLEAGSGVLWGRGSIVAHADQPEDQRSGLPEGFSIAWTDRVELAIAREDEPVDGLKTANFVGDVKVIDPRFTMSGGQLKVRFDPQADGSGRRFAGVDASDNVVVKSDDGTIKAQQLDLSTAERADGRIVPTTLVASGNVHVADKTQKIDAGKLRVRFRETPIDQTKTKIDIATVAAADGVTVAMADGTKVEATTLDADNVAGTAYMTGEPVTIVQDDSEIRVARLKLTKDGNIAEADGKGEFVMIEPGTDARPDGRRVNVRWTDSMRYSEADKRLDVAGGVVVEQSDRPAELNRLAAEKLRIDLRDREQLGEDAPDRSLLKKLTATDNVVVLATKWATPKRQTVQTRLRIAGPTLTFIDATEIVDVIGPGSMLIEDYRPGGNDDKVGAVAVSGRGATLFTWTGGMTLDGARTDVTINGGVNMTHKPTGDQGLLELQTAKLTADMKGIGGLQVIDMANVESLEIDHIEATGQVQVRDKQRLISSHRLYFDGEKQTVLLEAQPGRQVSIVKVDEPKPIKAGKITWDLTKDRVEIDKVGY
jgi:lipopolysaccharide export system protein LptA